MVTPLSNDKIPSGSSERSSTAQQKSAAQQSEQPATSTPSAASPNREVEDTLELSSSGHTFSVTQTRPSAAVVKTPQQAAELTTRIREQLEQAGTQALAVHKDIQADQLSNLLSSAPA